MPPPSIVRHEANLHGRDFAVGDIHGAFSALQAALTAIAFDPSCDRLFSVGDLVDRGPESDQVEQWLDLPWFHAIMGNHDLLAWHRALGNPFDQVDHLRHGGQWLDDLPSAQQQQLGQRLAALPLVREVETPDGLVGLVHADFPSYDWRDAKRVDWRDLDSMNSVAGSCLWWSMRHQQRDATPVEYVHAVVHGHTTLPAMEQLGNVYFIDTGGWRPSGRFTFLNLWSLTVLTGPVSA
ncbi:metallophosphoesterase [Ottowia sp.]|uniref:metallophosphoesterase n=1 Tax=Ottowia sp. TaxID=1898956 RepID=UPI003A83CCB8